MEPWNKLGMMSRLRWPQYWCLLCKLILILVTMLWGQLTQRLEWPQLRVRLKRRKTSNQAIFRFQNGDNWEQETGNLIIINVRVPDSCCVSAPNKELCKGMVDIWQLVWSLTIKWKEMLENLNISSAPDYIPLLYYYHHESLASLRSEIAVRYPAISRWFPHSLTESSSRDASPRSRSRSAVILRLSGESVSLSSSSWWSTSSCRSTSAPVA